MQGGSRNAFPFPTMKMTFGSHFHYGNENEFSQEMTFPEMSYFHYGNGNEMTFPGQVEKMTFRKWLFPIMEITPFHHGNGSFPLRDGNEMTFPGQLEEMTFLTMTFFHHGQKSFSFPWWKWIPNKKVISIMEMKMSFPQRKSFPFRWWKWVLAAWKWILGRWKWLLGYENEFQPSDFHFHWLKSHFGDENEFRVGDESHFHFLIMKMTFS